MYEWAEFRHFRYLLKILEKGGFRAAAEELYTSQPNLTVQARQFQDHASVRLFRKLKSGQIRPTETEVTQCCIQGVFRNRLFRSLKNP